MDGIANRARANKQLVYRYFGTKAELYRTVSGKILAERAATLETSPAPAADQVVHWFASALEHPAWIRLRQWEALETRGKVVEGKKRREHFKVAVAAVEPSQAREEQSSEFDPKLLLLLLRPRGVSGYGAP